tara:strand:+ start:365 stop:637 length:273 start_codon:yes stop_codon:yes gene_type:complete
MAIKVTVGSSSGSSAPRTSATVTSSATKVSAVASGSKLVTNAKVEQLANIDTTTNGLEDGYTLVYDEPTGQWVTQLAEAVTVDNLDGGSY